MSEHDELRRYFVECRNLIDGCKDPAEKHGWLLLAETWLRQIREPVLSSQKKNDDYVF